MLSSITSSHPLLLIVCPFSSSSSSYSFRDGAQGKTRRKAAGQQVQVGAGGLLAPPPVAKTSIHGRGGGGGAGSIGGGFDGLYAAPQQGQVCTLLKKHSWLLRKNSHQTPTPSPKSHPPLQLQDTLHFLPQATSNNNPTHNNHPSVMVSSNNNNHFLLNNQHFLPNLGRVAPTIGLLNEPQILAFFREKKFFFPCLALSLKVGVPLPFLWFCL